MKTYDLGSLAGHLTFITGIGYQCADDRPNPAFSPQNFQELIERADALEKKLRELALPVGADSAKRVLDTLRAVSPLKDGRFGLAGEQKFRVNRGIQMISNSLDSELRDKLFIVVPSDKSAYFQPREPLFNPAVIAKFGGQTEDMFEAGNCFALGRWTACVFHLMRLLEVGVQRFGELLGVTLIDSRGKEKVWQNILDEANKAIRALDQNAEKTKGYAAISANLYSVKLAWRNEVMHPKDTYTEEQARGVFDAARTFMAELASVL